MTLIYNINSIFLINKKICHKFIEFITIIMRFHDLQARIKKQEGESAYANLNDLPK